MALEAGRLKVTRKQFMLGGGALAVTALLLRFVGARQTGESMGDSRWYEVVQDQEKPSLWHVNLFSGEALGDLSRATLIQRRAHSGNDVASIKRDMEFPWRIQKLDGHKEQSF